MWDNWWRQLAVVGLSLFLFLLACVTPALVFLRNGVTPESWLGIQVLGLGWMGVFIGQFGWYANPLLLVSQVLLVFRCWVSALIVAGLALLVAANTGMLFSQEVPADEANTNRLTLEHLGPGCYLWLASMLVIAVGAVALKMRQRHADALRRATPGG